MIDGQIIDPNLPLVIKPGGASGIQHALNDFLREMKEVVVPRIERDMAERERLAIEARQRFMR